MKKVILVLAFLLLASNCFAEVTAEVIGKDIDTNGNIIIKTAYFLDGVNVESRYPQATIKDKDGKDIKIYYYQTRYTFQNFVGMDDEQVIERIDKDLTAYSQNLIAQKYTIAENAKATLDGVVGHKVTTTEAVMKVSPTLEYTVNTAGEKTERILTATDEKITP